VDLVNDCAEVRLALGAHALGALEPDEDAEVRAHLQGCAACRDLLATIAPVPAVLGRLSAAEALALQPTPGPGLLERTTAALRRQRRGLRLRRGLAAGIGAVVLAGGAAAVAVAVSRPATQAAVAVAHFSGSDAATGVSATADVYRESWGSSIHLTITGAPSGYSCELMAVGWNGSQEAAGSWWVGDTGNVGVDGTAGMQPDQLASLEVVASDGMVLVTLGTS